MNTKLQEQTRFFSLPCVSDASNRLWLAFRVPLDRKTATGVSLLSRVLLTGCEEAKDRSALLGRLDSLYGSQLEAAALRKGDEQLLVFSLSVPRLARDSRQLWEKALALLKNVLLEPQLRGDGFLPERIDREKQALARALAARQDDRASWAQRRCIQWMCRQEAFGVDPDGYVEDLDAITAGELYRLWRRILRYAPLEILYAGENWRDQERLVRDLVHEVRQEGAPDTGVSQAKQPGPPRCPKRIFEPLAGCQGNLVMGWRSQGDYLPLLLAAEVLGGGGASRLFASLREKSGLCYSVSAYLLRHKKILLAQAGLAAETMDAAAEEMARIVAELPETLEEEEVAEAKASLLHYYQSLKESPAALADFVLDQALAGEDTSLDVFCDRLRAVTREEVARAAAGLGLDTIYLLAERI